MMEFHEYANLFPMMNAEEMQELRADMRSNGYRKEYPIFVYDGKILDGRNRYTAALAEKIEPLYVEYDGDDPFEFVISSNKKRRQLSAGQWAFIAVKVKEHYAAKAKENQGTRTDLSQNFEKGLNEPIDATAIASKQIGVNYDYVSAAAQIEEHAPDIADNVKSGQWSMNRAKTEYKKRKKKEKVQAYTEQVKEKPALQKEYNVIYADPPWQYSENTNTLDAVTDHHYATMSIEQLKSYLDDINIKTQKDAVLFMWVTNPFLKKALEVVEAWGFEYKSNIVWVKTELKKPGVGYYVRGRHELLYICTKGSFTPLDRNISPPIGSVLQEPVAEHSKKPAVVYEIIERLYPGCLYLELFARNIKDGWNSIGDDA